MTPYPHQQDIAKEAYTVLAKYGLVYLSMEERTGKTLASIILAEMTTRDNILVLTKKSALMGENDTHWKTAQEGWYGTFNKYGGVHSQRDKPDGYPTWEINGTSFTATNYHSAIKLKAEYNMCILDEAHSYLSAYPKRGSIWKSVKQLTKDLPLVYLSATPYAQGYQLLYNQLALSCWSPFKRYKSFYRFFEDYGVPSKVRTSYGLQETYKKCKVSAWIKCKHLFITYTRAELGFEHEPEDKIRYFELDEQTKEQYNKCLKDEMFVTEDFEIPLDSSMKLRVTLHMLEGGVTKDEGQYIVLDNEEKIQAILKDFGDTTNLVVFYHYKAEFIKLQRYFKNATLAQATSKAEGVDYSKKEYMVVYSMDFSTARHSQRRARQANLMRATPIKVHFYLVKGAISEQVYKCVSDNKVNFMDSLFSKEIL